MLTDKRIKEAQSSFNSYLQDGLVAKKKEFEQRIFNILENNANESLKIAEMLFANRDSWLWTIVTSYYSMYYIANAVLYKMGYKAGTHLATICVLCKECLGKTLERKDIENISAILELSEEEIKEMGRAKERREKASYSGSVSFEKHLAEMTLDDARKFINKMADILES